MTRMIQYPEALQNWRMSAKSTLSRRYLATWWLAFQAFVLGWEYQNIYLRCIDLFTMQRSRLIPNQHQHVGPINVTALNISTHPRILFKPDILSPGYLDGPVTCCSHGTSIQPSQIEAVLLNSAGMIHCGHTRMARVLMTVVMSRGSNAPAP